MPAPADSNRTLLSVALNHPKEVTSGFFGHEVTYQRALVEAARRHQIDACVLLPFPQDSADDDVVSLCHNGQKDWVEGLRALLCELPGREVTVLFYEGSIEVVRCAAHLARLHTDVVFVVNLFARDRQLAVPSLSQRSFVAGLHIRTPEDALRVAGCEDPDTDRQPANLVVYADTERRRVLAQSFGLREVRVWPLYSVVRVGEVSTRRPSAQVRVVVPVAAWQVTRQLLYELATVIQLTDRYAPPGRSIQWVVFGGGYQSGWRHRSRRRRMARLRRLGVHFTPSGIPGDEYAQTLAEADVVWLPQRGFYTTQSSGKVADALVVGTPVFAPNGSYPAQEMDRWIPGTPAYTGVREAVELFLHVAPLATTLQRALEERREEIVSWYSPDRAVLEVMEVSAEVRRRLEPWDAQSASSQGRAGPATPIVFAAREVSTGERIARIVRTRGEQLRAGIFELAVRLKTIVRFR